MTETTPPEWALERAADLSGVRQIELAAPIWVGHAFARYIAEHEEPPPDPLLVEAREVAAAKCDYQGRCGSQGVRDGYSDEADDVQLALAALRRGMELARKNNGSAS